MIKKLLFTAALLVPGLAYGADPSANLPIQIVPASAVPAAAQAAGFTSLIINDNFQSAAFASPSTWLDCNDGSTPPSSPLYYRSWVGFGTNIDGPCNAIGQATDPLIGQLALRIHWQDSYFSGNNGHGHNIPVQTTNSSGNGRQTPPGFYIEVVARSDSACPTCNAGMDVWSYTQNAGSYEIDGFEEFANGTGGTFAIHNNERGSNGSCADINATPPCTGVRLDTTQYHTYAWRQTSAGTDIVFCAYVDGTKYGCNSITPTSAELASAQPGYSMVHQLSMGTTGTPNPIGNGSTGRNTWIKSFKVWSCAGVNSGALCRSSSNNP